MDKHSALGKLNSGRSTPFFAYGDAALTNGAISIKYKEPVTLGVTPTTQRASCLKRHKQAAIQAGAIQKELTEVIHATAAMRAGAAVTHLLN